MRRDFTWTLILTLRVMVVGLKTQINNERSAN